MTNLCFAIEAEVRKQDKALIRQLAEPQVVIAQYDQRATPCVLSWNTLSVGEHRLYTESQVQAMLTASA